jgi:RNase adaptor protein for sRNA GlmZ degradation
MKNIKNLMTELELSTYNILERLFENLHEAVNSNIDSISLKALELSMDIYMEMIAIHNKVVHRSKRLFGDKNYCYFTDESFTTRFTGIAYWDDEYDNFYQDNGVADELCYFVNGKIVRYNFERNCIPYVTVDAWHVLPDKLSGGKSALIFNLGCRIPEAIETGVDLPYSLSDNILELVSRRLKAAEAKGITAYKMK